MRGRNLKRSIDWPSKKRALLRTMLFATVPMAIAPLGADSASADSPIVMNQLTLPPLPLDGQTQTSTGNPAQKPNPFCLPTPVTEGGEGSMKTTTMRLYPKPVLGLPQPVSMGVLAPAESTVKLTSGDEGPVEESSETIVQIFPLDRPAPRSTSSVDASESAAKASNAAGAIRANPMVIVEPASIERPQAILLPVEPLAAEVPEVPAVPAPVTAPKAMSGSSPNTAPKVEAVTVEGPVSFSLNDDRLVDNSTTRQQPEKAPVAMKRATPAPKSTELADIVRQQLTPEPSPAKAVAKTATKPTVVTVEQDPAVTLNRGKGAARLLLVPLDPVVDSKPVSMPTAPDARIVKGARPRVDVGVPPVAIERESVKKTSVVAQVGTTESVSKPKEPSPDAAMLAGEATAVGLKRTEVRALKLASEIRKVQVGDSSICAAIGAGPSQLQLIGVRDGVTRIAVWTASTGAEETKTVYEITVGAPASTDKGEAITVANTLTRTAQAAFPGSDIRVRHEDGRMIVEGACTDNDSAKQALRMIRSACLLPVIDKLTVR